MRKRKSSIFRRIKLAFKRWKTSKTVLFIAIIACVLYTILNCLFALYTTIIGNPFNFDSTLTSEWFEFWKWVVISGGSITVAKVVKGKSTVEDNKKEETKG